MEPETDTAAREKISFVLVGICEGDQKVSNDSDFEIDRLRGQLADVDAQIAQLGVQLTQLRELREQILHEIGECEDTAR